ncbi:MAG: WYL domain-containing protein [Alphaproteobacteria bacterium]|nr:WYL domain-containing protein [Alphaproteobacteria bacterium]MCB9692350.1 WYL domain-containing protein [Alphaproteobacteria bacterium]
MNDTLHRVLALLALLHRRRVWAGPELAEELGVTARCLRRDVQRLRDLGYPVHSSSGPGGGYTLGAGEQLPPLPLDDEEAVAVAVGLRAAVVGPVDGLQEPALRALTKLEVVLPARLRRRLGALEAVSVTLPRHPARIDARVLEGLARCCRDGLRARFGYTSRGRSPSVRRVEPYRLVHTDTRWSLLAWDLERSDWRTFRLDRVAPGTLEPGEAYAPRPLPDPDVSRYVTRQVTAEPFPVRVTARLGAEAAWVRAQLGPWAWVEPDGDGWCRVELGGEGFAQLTPWLVMLDVPIEDVEPEGMREALRRVGERMLSAAR